MPKSTPVVKLIMQELQQNQASDVIITYELSCKKLQNIFCFNLHNNNPNISNIINNSIKLFTFVNNDDKSLSVDISKLNINKTPTLNISTEFLTFLAKKKHNREDYHICINNYKDIQTYINISCCECAMRDFDGYKKNANISSYCKETTHTNETCSKLLSMLFNQCPERFCNSNKIKSLPFLIGDVIVYYYTIKTCDITRIYEIRAVIT